MKCHVSIYEYPVYKALTPLVGNFACFLSPIFSSSEPVAHGELL